MSDAVTRLQFDPPPSPIPGYLTTAEISARYNVHQEHVGTLIRTGKVLAIRVGSIYLVKQEDWDQYEQTKSKRGVPRGRRKTKK